MFWLIALRRFFSMLTLLTLAIGSAGTARAQGIESVLAPGKLTQSHVKAEADCKNCHVKFERKAQDTRCTECHKDVGTDVRDKKGFHGRKLLAEPQACRNCHTDHKGRDAKIVEFDEKAFDHNKLSDFELRGKHIKAECKTCHVAGKKFRDAALDCNSCHKKDDVHKSALGPKCESCHGESDWKKTTFDHAKTKFALDFKHADVKCSDCHKDQRYQDTPRTCVGCHKKDDDQIIKGRRGHQGQFGEKCESCHNAKGWKPSTFNHDTDTKYKLLGKHKPAECKSCHTGNLYKQKLANDCNSCHVKDDKHKGTLGKDCAACHNERGWKDQGKFDHSKTKFPLLGKHDDIECKACHKTPVYNDAPKECIGCHLKDDKHKATLGKDCGACHGERDWKTTKGKFDHDKTKFALRNSHTAPKTECKACHADLTKFRDTARDCLSCHKKDDKHEGNLGKACESCHNDTHWKATKGLFDHDKTKFALRNGHAGPKVECKSCHQSLKQMRDTSRDCISCHKKDDKHEGQLGKACEACHTDKDWKTTTTFDHAKSRFALTGKHVVTACKDCHTTGARYKDAPMDCYSCHKKADKHKLKLGTACESCHNTRDWSLWDFDHDKRTDYKLVGPHRKPACDACHTREAPKGKPTAPIGTACVACHRKDDVHDGNYGPRCEQCHVVDKWKVITNRGMRSSSRGDGPASDPLDRTLFPAWIAHALRAQQLGLSSHSTQSAFERAADWTERKPS